ncbi:hypothetical protein ACFVZD_33990 [Streptomyces sp. NPDC058287]|uniref:hypothetical protein n=1 Tax=unclassified Streptomyces TaxID=2593676 RepID=UPI0036E53D43
MTENVRREALLRVGTITGIDAEATTIRVGRTRDQIKSAPEFDTNKHLGVAGCHERVGMYCDAPGTPGTPGARPAPRDLTRPAQNGGTGRDTRSTSSPCPRQH